MWKNDEKCVIEKNSVERVVRVVLTCSTRDCPFLSKHPVHMYTIISFLDLLLQNCCTAIAECWKTAFTRVIRQFLRAETGVHAFRALQWEFLFRNYASLKNLATPAVSVPLIVSYITLPLPSRNRPTKLQRARERERERHIYNGQLLFACVPLRSEETGRESGRNRGNCAFPSPW